MNPSVFPMGNELPEEYSKYFIGQAYLKALTEKGSPIDNVTLSEQLAYSSQGRANSACNRRQRLVSSVG